MILCKVKTCLLVGTRYGTFLGQTGIGGRGTAYSLQTKKCVGGNQIWVNLSSSLIYYFRDSLPSISLELESSTTKPHPPREQKSRVAFSPAFFPPVLSLRFCSFKVFGLPASPTSMSRKQEKKIFFLSNQNKTEKDELFLNGKPKDHHHTNLSLHVQLSLQIKTDISRTLDSIFTLVYMQSNISLEKWMDLIISKIPLNFQIRNCYVSLVKVQYRPLVTKCF